MSNDLLDKIVMVVLAFAMGSLGIAIWVVIIAALMGGLTCEG